MFSARIGQVHSQDERAQLEKSQAEHLKNVRAFRTIQSRLAMLSESSVNKDSSGSGGEASTLLVAMDGLDQSKTRWPRNLKSAKCLDKLWRPQVHLVGYIAYGATLLAH